MPSSRTPFQKAVSDLKAPSTAAYNQQEWDDAYRNAIPTLSDFRLFEAAKWIALEAEEARKKFPSPAFGPLSAEWATILAVAALNREYRTAIELNSKALKERAADEPFISADAMLGVRISSETGQHFTVEDLTESSTDLTENWIFDALSAQGVNPPPLELSGYAITAGRIYSFKKAMNTLWNQAKHDGWFVEKEPDGTSHWDANSRPDAILNQTWLQRQQSNLMNYPHIEVSVWPKLSVSQRR